MTGRITRRAFGGAVGTAGLLAFGLAGGRWAGSRAALQPGGQLPSRAPLPAAYRLPYVVPPLARPVRTDATTDYYEITQQEASQQILPGLRTPLWTYGGTFPGPTVVSRTGRRTVVRHTNELPAPVVVHLHGGHVPSGSDGFPTDALLPVGVGPQEYFGQVATQAGTRTVLGPTGRRAGAGNDGGAAEAFLGTIPDPAAVIASGSRDYIVPPPRRSASLWYHDHWMGFTGRSMWRGLLGLHLVVDDADEALGLPQGERDLPVLICDRAFGEDGSLTYPFSVPMQAAGHTMATPYMDGVLGDVILVNGVPWPRLEVAGARYRLRLVNGSNARAYALALDPPPPGGGALVQVGSDGGLLERPLARDQVALSPGERCDVVVDFARYAPGARVELVNLAGSGSTRQVMLFEVGARSGDASRVPARLSTITAHDPARAVVTRQLAFQRYGGLGGRWTINGEAFDPRRVAARPRLGDLEVWRLSSDVAHPVHLHLEQFQVLARAGSRPGPDDHGWKDTVSLRPGEALDIAVRFTDYAGRFLVHCHNVEHEDMGMMATIETW